LREEKMKINLRRIEARILAAEGLGPTKPDEVTGESVLIPYLDTEGVPTIGPGITHFNGKKVTMKTKPIPLVHGFALMRFHIFEAAKDASTFVENFSQLSSVRQEALLEMAYQLGGPGLRGFRKMRKAIEARDWEEACREGLDSKWAKKDTPRRARIVCEMIRTGIHYFEAVKSEKS
jgi:lysozyme